MWCVSVSVFELVVNVCGVLWWMLCENWLSMMINVSVFDGELV